MDYIRDAIDYLVNFESLKKSLDNLRCKIMELQFELKTIKEINYSGMPQGSGAKEPDDRLVNIMYNIEQFKREYKLTRRKVSTIQKVIANLPEPDKKIIKAYYIKGLRGESLLKELHCSESEMYRDKRKALRVVAINIHGIKVLQ